MKSDKIVWGLVFVFIGSILLLDNFGVIDFSWGAVWRLWPLLLIIWGVELMFSGKNNPAGPWIAGVVTLVALIFAGYYGATHASDDSLWLKNLKWNRGGRVHNSAKFKSNSFSEPFSDSIKIAELNITGGATTYRLKDSTSNLFDADIKQQFGNYSLTRTTRDSIEVLFLKMPDSAHTRGSRNFDLNKVEMKLNNKPVWDINLEMGAGKADFDLSKFKISRLNIEGGAASFQIKLGEPQTSTNVTVETGVSKVKISVPSSVGCLIKVDSGLSSNDFDGFNKQNDNTYITDNYGSSSKRIIINLEGGISDFEVNRY
ncbi:MAG TPA: DUF5668 domain-containing protein [Sphingobacteriaceae bacterium]|nr:DUF5668 domain-containing protein [Sphingobacteriaceae bacterium]